MFTPTAAGVWGAFYDRNLFALKQYKRLAEKYYNQFNIMQTSGARARLCVKALSVIAITIK